MADLDAKTILEDNEIFNEFKGSLTEQYVLCQLKEYTDLNVRTSMSNYREEDWFVNIP